MKEWKGFIAGLLAAAVVAGTVGTAGAVVGRTQANLDYSDIKISVNGEQVTPADANGNVVEPFAINGTTYLPVRAVGNALGLDVVWDGTTNTVEMDGVTDNSSLSFVRLMGFYKILEESFEELVNQAESLQDGLMKEMVNMPVEDSNSEYYGMTFGDLVKGNLADDLDLAEEYYESCRYLLQDDGIALMSRYRDLNQRIVGYIDSAASGSSVEMPTIVWIDCEMGKTDADLGFWTAYQDALN